ncbi:MAG: response regulator, partial [Actinobacteria bacterium]|nr:response regulator [Actinomycetota bacterium]
MIGDDNRDFCELVKDYIDSQEDFELAGTAFNGLDVVDLVAKAEPDVVVLDIIMPHLDGIGVLERLSAMNLPRRPKIIMLTAFGQENITQRVLELGADYYVLKPFNLEVLGTRIRQLVSSSSGATHVSRPAPAYKYRN